MPAALTNIETLLPLNKLQQVVQHYGCPSFYDATRDSSSTVNNGDGVVPRVWYVHFFTGRVPTPAEFYYGVYVDRIGDTHKSATLTLSGRHLGWFSVRNDATALTGASTITTVSIGHEVQAHGALWPAGQIFMPTPIPSVPYKDEAFTRLPPAALSDATWVLDWSFAPAAVLSLNNGNRANLRSLAGSGLLVVDGAPTWFWISGSPDLPIIKSRPVDSSKTDNAWRARIEQLSNAATTDDLAKRPVIMGTVGQIGSGAGLELGPSAWDIPAPDVVRPLALRARLVATTAG